ncbi:MAG TPA: hypothetical protein VIM70_08490 [Clostridium sp.]|uniref:hypothetical protein n=1 Tax=Clostridium sp. TaxID=1506 RepID=UPI002F91D18E
MDNSNYDKLLRYSFQSMYYAIITDDKGRVKFLSKNYQKLLNIDEEHFYDKPIQEIIVDSEIPRVLKSRKEEIGHLFTLKNGLTVVCNRIPIIENEKLYGVISIASFYNLNDVSILEKQIKDLQKENLGYKKKIHELSSSKQQDYINNVIGNSKSIMGIKL